MNFELSDKISSHLRTIKSQSNKMNAECVKPESGGQLHRSSSIETCCFDQNMSAALLSLIDEYLFNKRQSLTRVQAGALIELIDLTADSIENGNYGIVNLVHVDDAQSLARFAPVIGFGAFSIENYRLTLLHHLLNNSAQKENYQDHVMHRLGKKLRVYLGHAQNAHLDGICRLHDSLRPASALLDDIEVRDLLPAGPFDTRFFGVLT
jgi:hypothetical protein